MASLNLNYFAINFSWIMCTITQNMRLRMREKRDEMKRVTHPSPSVWRTRCYWPQDSNLADCNKQKGIFTGCTWHLADGHLLRRHSTLGWHSMYGCWRRGTHHMITQLDSFIVSSLSSVAVLSITKSSRTSTPRTNIQVHVHVLLPLLLLSAWGYGTIQ